MNVEYLGNESDDCGTTCASTLNEAEVSGGMIGGIVGCKVSEFGIALEDDESGAAFGIVGNAVVDSTTVVEPGLAPAGLVVAACGAAASEGTVVVGVTVGRVGGAIIWGGEAFGNVKSTTGGSAV